MFYNKGMYFKPVQRAWLLSFAAFTCLLLVPAFAHAQVSGALQTIIPVNQCNCASMQSAPDWGCVLGTIQIIIQDAVAFAAIIITIFLAWAGVTFMMSPTNPEARGKARQRLINAVIGLVIVLCAWLVIDSLLKVVYNATASADGVAQLGPWNQILSTGGSDCIQTRSGATPLPGLGAAGNPTGSVAGVPPTQVNNGTPTATVSGPSNQKGCTVQASGPCSPAALQNTCLSFDPTRMSEICTHESGGNPAVINGSRATDILVNDNGLAYGGGLFGINLTYVTDLGPDHLNCSQAFSGKCGSGTGNLLGGGHCAVTITNMPLYQQCVAEISQPANAIQQACSASQQFVGAHKSQYGPWQNECAPAQ
jgi:hypothetical protein